MLERLWGRQVGGIVLGIEIFARRSRRLDQFWKYRLDQQAALNDTLLLAA